MLRSFAHPVACCWVMLGGVVAQILKPVKLLATYKRMQQLPTLWGQKCQQCSESFVRSFITPQLLAHLPVNKKVHPIISPTPSSLSFLEFDLLYDVFVALFEASKCKTFFDQHCML